MQSRLRLEPKAETRDIEKMPRVIVIQCNYNVVPMQLT